MPREAVGHQLDAHGVALRPALGADLAEHAELVLDVVAVLVRDHVADREGPALRTELPGEHVVEEVGVEVDHAVVRAVERAHRPRWPDHSRSCVEPWKRTVLTSSYGLPGLVGIGLRPEVLHRVGEQVDRTLLGLVRVGAGVAGVLAAVVAGRRSAARQAPLPVHWVSTTNRMMTTIVPMPILPAAAAGHGQPHAAATAPPPDRVSIWLWSILAFGLNRIAASFRPLAPS